MKKKPKPKPSKIEKKKEDSGLNEIQPDGIKGQPQEQELSNSQEKFPEELETVSSEIDAH